MKRFYALLSYLRLKDESFAAKAAVIVLSFTGNTYYPGVIPEVVAFTDAAKDFAEALSSAADGSKLSKAVRDAARLVANRAMEDLVAYVNLNGKTREALLSTGLPVSANEVVVSADPEILGIKFFYGPNSGTLEILVRRSNATSVTVEICADAIITPSSVWILAYQTIGRAKFTDLTVGKAVWCRAIAAGTRNRRVVSAAVQSKVVQ
jgi:hypothetical protein